MATHKCAAPLLHVVLTLESVLIGNEDPILFKGAKGISSAVIYRKL